MQKKEVELLYGWDVRELFKELQSLPAGYSIKTYDLKDKVVILVNNFSKRDRILLETMLFVNGALVTNNPEEANMFIFGDSYA